MRQQGSSGSGSESVGLAFSASSNWIDSSIVDNRATCHVYCRKLFVELHSMQKAMKVTLGDGHELEAIECGVMCWSWEKRENIWYGHFSHLGARSLQNLAM